jgi:hypothetical protein
MRKKISRKMKRKQVLRGGGGINRLLLTVDDRTYTLKAIPFYDNGKIKSIEGQERLETQYKRLSQNQFDGEKLYEIVSTAPRYVKFRQVGTSKEYNLYFFNGFYRDCAQNIIVEINSTEPRTDDIIEETPQMPATKDLQTTMPNPQPAEKEETKCELFKQPRKIEDERDLDTPHRSMMLKQFVQQDYVLRFKYRGDDDQPRVVQLLKKFSSAGPFTDELFLSLKEKPFLLTKDIGFNIYFEYDLETQTITMKCSDSVWDIIQDNKHIVQSCFEFLKHQIKNNGVPHEIYNEHKKVYIILGFRNFTFSKFDTLLNNPDFHMDGGMFVSITSKNRVKDYNFGTEYIFNSKKLEFEEKSGMKFMTSEYKNAVPHLKRILQDKESVGVSHIVNNGDTFIFHDSLGVHTIPSNRYQIKGNEILAFDMRLLNISSGDKETDYEEIHHYEESTLKLCQNPIDMTKVDSQRDLIIALYTPVDKLDYFEYVIEGWQSFRLVDTIQLDDTEPTQSVICITLLNDDLVESPDSTQKLEPGITKEIQIPASEFFESLYNVGSAGEYGSCLTIEDFRLLTRGGKKLKTKRKRLKRAKKKRKTRKYKK